MIQAVRHKYIGVDFHPHQQMVAWCDKETGETQTLEMDHDLEKVREFCSSLAEPAMIGIELILGRVTAHKQTTDGEAYITGYSDGWGGQTARGGIPLHSKGQERSGFKR